MRVYTVWIILLGVALHLGGPLGLRPTAPAVWALPPSPRRAPQLPQAPTPRLRVTVTAYSHPRTAASGRHVRPGIVALSRDVEQALGVAFGDRVVLEGLGTFVFDDRVSARFRRRADVFLVSPQAARRFGVKVTQVRVVRANMQALELPPVSPLGPTTPVHMAMCAPTCGQEEGG
jgi:3D (Asp-Asp-Asp) domain-containing protein